MSINAFISQDGSEPRHMQAYHLCISVWWDINVVIIASKITYHGFDRFWLIIEQWRSQFIFAKYTSNVSGQNGWGCAVMLLNTIYLSKKSTDSLCNSFSIRGEYSSGVCLTFEGSGHLRNVSDLRPDEFLILISSRGRLNEKDEVSDMVQHMWTFYVKQKERTED